MEFGAKASGPKSQQQQVASTALGPLPPTGLACHCQAPVPGLTTTTTGLVAAAEAAAATVAMTAAPVAQVGSRA